MRRTRVVSAVASVVASALVAGLVLSSCFSVTPYAAIVNGHRISQGEINSELDAIRHNKAYINTIEQQVPVLGKARGTFTSDFVARVLSRRIFLEFVHQEVLRRHLSLDLAAARTQVQRAFSDPAEFTGFPRAYRDTVVRRSAEVAALSLALSSTKVDDAAISAYYDANRSQFQETCVRHILVGAKAQADQARARIVAGEDFAAVAKATSQDTGSAARGGDLGCLTSAQTQSLVPEFAQAVTSLQVNELSQPVQTQFGFHLIQLTARRTQPLEQVASSIRTQLVQQSQSSLNDFLDKVVPAARVTVNPRYGSFAKDGPQPGVVAPNAPSVPTSPGRAKPIAPAGAGGLGGSGVPSPSPGAGSGGQQQSPP
ncbi:MAG TPA: peptidylprolyl isomerase [Acidimicrobiales bacterium]|nr:peptidylprolyl isomerase [Acidimicrobiales bacterium]